MEVNNRSQTLSCKTKSRVILLLRMIFIKSHDGASSLPKKCCYLDLNLYPSHNKSQSEIIKNFPKTFLVLNYR